MVEALTIVLGVGVVRGWRSTLTGVGAAGIVLAALHNPAAAEGHFAQALRIHPDLASANYNLGLALKQQGKTNEAQTYFDKAERLKRGEINAEEAIHDLESL